jgi:hypothetical protein
MPRLSINISAVGKAMQARCGYSICSPIISTPLANNNCCDKWRQRTVNLFSSKHGPFARLSRGLEEFFENGQALPKQYISRNPEPENYGKYNKNYNNNNNNKYNKYNNNKYNNYNNNKYNKYNNNKYNNYNLL